MKKTDNSKLNKKDIMLWVILILLTLSTFLITQYLSLTGPIKAILWILWLILAFVIGYFTAQGKQLLHFIKEAKIELQKVVWPTRQETIQVTSIVMIMVTVTSFILWGVDSLMIWAIAKLTSLG